MKGFKKEKIEEEPAEMKQRLRYLEDQIAHLKNDPSTAPSDTTNPSTIEITASNTSPPGSHGEHTSSRGRTHTSDSPKRRT